MKRRWITVLAALILALCFTAGCAEPPGYTLHIEYSCGLPEGAEAPMGDLISDTIRTIGTRLDEYGLTDREIYRVGMDGLAVDIRGLELTAGDIEAAEKADGFAVPESASETVYEAEEAAYEEAAEATNDEEDADIFFVGFAETVTEGEMAEAAEETEAAEEPAEPDPAHAGMKTLYEELTEDGYVLYTDGYGNYGYEPGNEDGLIPKEINFSEDGAVGKVLDLIGKRAVMRFVDADGYVFMKGDRIKNARYVNVTSSAATATTHQIEFELDDEGREIFARFTTKYLGNYIDIWLDNERLVHAVVNDPITDGRGLISGAYTQEEAEAVAAKIRSGALPLELTLESVQILETGGAAAAAENAAPEAADSAWTCPVCGGESTGAFCPWCGAAKPEEVTPVVCPACGAEYEPDIGYLFCMKCGARLKDPVEGVWKATGMRKRDETETTVASNSLRMTLMGGKLIMDYSDDNVDYESDDYVPPVLEGTYLYENGRLTLKITYEGTDLMEFAFDCTIDGDTMELADENTVTVFVRIQ